MMNFSTTAQDNNSSKDEDAANVVHNRSLEVLVPWKNTTTKPYHRKLKSLTLDQRKDRMREAAEMRRALNWMIKSDGGNNDTKAAEDAAVAAEEHGDDMTRSTQTQTPESPVDFTEKG